MGARFVLLLLLNAPVCHAISSTATLVTLTDYVNSMGARCLDGSPYEVRCPASVFCDENGIWGSFTLTYFTPRSQLWFAPATSPTNATKCVIDIQVY